MSGAFLAILQIGLSGRPLRAGNFHRVDAHNKLRAAANFEPPEF